MRRGALPLEPENCQVGDPPALQFTRAVVDAVCVLATDGSRELNVTAPGVVLKVQAALAAKAVPRSNANTRPDALVCRRLAMASFTA